MSTGNVERCDAAVPLLEDSTVFLLEAGIIKNEKDNSIICENDETDDAKSHRFPTIISAIVGFDAGYFGFWLATFTFNCVRFKNFASNYDDRILEVCSVLWVAAIAVLVLWLNFLFVRALQRRFTTLQSAEEMGKKFDFCFSIGSLTGIMVAAFTMINMQEGVSVSLTEQFGFSMLMICANYALGVAIQYVYYRYL